MPHKTAIKFSDYIKLLLVAISAFMDKLRSFIAVQLTMKSLLVSLSVVRIKTFFFTSSEDLFAQTNLARKAVFSSLGQCLISRKLFSRKIYSSWLRNYFLLKHFKNFHPNFLNCFSAFSSKLTKLFHSTAKTKKLSWRWCCYVLFHICNEMRTRWWTCVAMLCLFFCRHQKNFWVNGPHQLFHSRCLILNLQFIEFSFNALECKAQSRSRWKNWLSTVLSFNYSGRRHPQRCTSDLIHWTLLLRSFLLLLVLSRSRILIWCVVQNDSERLKQWQGWHVALLIAKKILSELKTMQNNNFW